MTFTINLLVVFVIIVILIAILDFLNSFIDSPPSINDAKSLIKKPTEKEKYLKRVQKRRVQLINNWDYALSYNIISPREGNEYYIDNTRKHIPTYRAIHLKIKWEETLSFLSAYDTSNSRNWHKVLRIDWDYIDFNNIMFLDKHNVRRIIENNAKIRFSSSDRLPVDIYKLIMLIADKDMIKQAEAIDKTTALIKQAKLDYQKKEQYEEDKKYAALNRWLDWLKPLNSHFQKTLDKTEEIGHEINLINRSVKNLKNLKKQITT